MGKPKIRFKGYTEDWEQRKVTELLKNSSSAMKIGPFGSALKKEYFVEEGIKVYAQENAFTGDFSMGDYYITEDKYKELKSCELYPGDLVISMMGTIGACAIFPKNAEKGIMNSHLLRLQFNNEVIPKYIMYLLRDSVLIRKQIDRLSVGSIMSGLSSSVVKKLVFPIPKLAEQKRIVEYLDSIDHLITLHQRKCDETKKLKKCMLQKMFPKEGEKVPEIRFSGFTGDWKQRKLNEVCKINGRIGFRGYTQKDIVSQEQGGVLTFSPTNIVDNTLTMKCRNTYITKEKYEESPEIKIKNGDILFVKTGSTLGKSALVMGLHENATINPQIVVLRTQEEEAKFLSVILISDSLLKKVAAVKIGGAVPTITEAELKNFTFYEPEDFAERVKIGNCFTYFDSIITFHQQKCDELKNIKKFMLQNMFVSEK